METLMKKNLLLFTAMIGFASVISGGVSLDAAEPQAPPLPTEVQYLITFAEYQLDMTIPLDASESEIIDKIRSSKSAPLETIRTTAMANTDTMVQFGRRVAVIDGTMSRGTVVARQTRDIEVGSILQVRIASHPKGAIADINYSTSRLADNGTDNSPPDVVNNKVQSSQILAIGEDRILSTSSSTKTHCIVVSVQTIP